MGVARRQSVLTRLAAERARPQWVRRRPGAHWLVVATVCVGAFMGQLDASIVTVAFPTLQREFHAGVGAVEWVALSYLLVLVCAVTAVGRLADMAGRKQLYTYGFGVFTVASVACGFAPNLLALDGLRVLQALGAAMLQANSVALIATAMPRDKLGRGIGVQGAAQALGLAVGPTLGGLLIALGGWQLIFLVNAPAGVVGMLLGWFFLPRSRHLLQRTRFDWGGLAAFVPAVGGVLAALSLGRDQGFGSPLVLSLAGVGLAGCVLFVAQERRASAPMVDLRLFSRVPFTAGITSGFLSYAVLFGALFVTPFLFEGGLGLSPRISGLVLTALPAALGLSAPLAGQLADRVGPRPLTVTGMLLAGLGLVAIAVIHEDVGMVAGELALNGLGLGMFTPPNNAAIMASAAREQSGTAGGLLNMTRGLGTAMGVALSGVVFGWGQAQAAGSSGIRDGATATVVVLAGLAVLAALLAALRKPTRLPAAEPAQAQCRRAVSGQQSRSIDLNGKRQ
ncbi:MAG: MFS transporter [Actinomycetota bacterium]|nr:MFS transporter [Actinomycetota bacterium]